MGLWRGKSDKTQVAYDADHAGFFRVLRAKSVRQSPSYGNL